jgi:hypothetical protein
VNRKILKPIPPTATRKPASIQDHRSRFESLWDVSGKRSFGSFVFWLSGALDRRTGGFWAIEPFDLRCLRTMEPTVRKASCASDPGFKQRKRMFPTSSNPGIIPPTPPMLPNFFSANYAKQRAKNSTMRYSETYGGQLRKQNLTYAGAPGDQCRTPILKPKPTRCLTRHVDVRLALFAVPALTHRVKRPSELVFHCPRTFQPSRIPQTIWTRSTVLRSHGPTVSELFYPHDRSTGEPADHRTGNPIKAKGHCRPIVLTCCW